MIRKNYSNFILLEFWVPLASSPAGNNSVVLMGGIVHHFVIATSADQLAANPSFIDCYSVSLQFNKQIRGPFGTGIRTMLFPFTKLPEEGVVTTSIPLLLSINYYFSEPGSNSQVQFAGGPIFHLRPSEWIEHGVKRNAFRTGYGIGVFSGYNLYGQGELGIFAETGLLYEKYRNNRSVKDSGDITALFHLGFSFNY